MSCIVERCFASLNFCKDARDTPACFFFGVRVFPRGKICDFVAAEEWGFFTREVRGVSSSAIARGAQSYGSAEADDERLES